jgi:FkbM family methyltransferase
MKIFSRHWSRNFVFCDVGARFGLEEPWESNRDCVDVISFEPDKEEYEVLSKKQMTRDKVLPYALFNEQKKINLNLTRSRGSSSIFQPNSSFLKKFPDVERFEVEATEEVQATTLDILYRNKKLQKLDFIKLDTQGAELDILRGGEKLINDNIIGLQIEVEFKRLYIGQPLFSDIDNYISNNFELELFDIRKTTWKYNEGVNVGPKKGQLIFGDALYFREPYSLLNWCSNFLEDEARNKILMACFMGLLYGYPDYSLCLLGRPDLNEFLGKKTIILLKEIVNETVRCKRFSFKGCGRIWKLFYLISQIFDPEPFEWATGERHLGSRKEVGIYY